MTHTIKRTLALMMAFLLILSVLFSCNAKEPEVYILNLRSGKIHKSDCGTANLIAIENRDVYQGDLDRLLSSGFTKCRNCFY